MRYDGCVCAYARVRERERAKEGSCANESNARDEERARNGGNPEFKIKLMLFVNAQSVPGLSDALVSPTLNQDEGAKRVCFECNLLEAVPSI